MQYPLSKAIKVTIAPTAKAEIQLHIPCICHNFLFVLYFITIFELKSACIAFILKIPAAKAIIENNIGSEITYAISNAHPSPALFLTIKKTTVERATVVKRTRLIQKMLSPFIYLLFNYVLIILSLLIQLHIFKRV